MSMLCDVCSEPLHMVKTAEGKTKIALCPLEPFRKVKSLYPPEFKGIIGRLFFKDNILEDSPNQLKNFAKLVPDTTQLETLFQYNGHEKFYIKTGIIQSSLEVFFKHFNRLLIDMYYSKKINFVDPTQEPLNYQFSYLWLNPTKLRECYFNQGGERFHNMSSLSTPSLVIYPLGAVESYDNKAWASIVTDLVTQRQSEGKATWILQTKLLRECVEVDETLKDFLVRFDSLVLEKIEEQENKSKELANGKNVSSYL